MKIQNYLHYYLGCRIKTNITFQIHQGDPIAYDVIDSDNYGYIISCLKDNDHFDNEYDCQLALRKLEDMTEEEADDIECAFIGEGDKYANFRSLFDSAKLDFYNTAELVTHLLSLHFDLFGLIDNNLAIDAKTIEK